MRAIVSSGAAFRRLVSSWLCRVVPCLLACLPSCCVATRPFVGRHLHQHKDHAAVVMRYLG